MDDVWPVGAETAVAIGQLWTTGKDHSEAVIKFSGNSTVTHVRADGKWKIRMMSVIPKRQ